MTETASSAPTATRVPPSAPPGSPSVPGGISSGRARPPSAGAGSRQNVAQKQKTLAGEAVVSGRGLFTGEPATMTMRPAPPDQGVVFVRKDLPGSPVVAARVEHVIERPRRTSIRDGEATVETVEHVLSALAGLGVDNATVELTGPEAPALDGSALPFVKAIRAAGLVEQSAVRRPIVLTESIVVGEGDSMIYALPSTSGAFDVLFDLDYGAGSALGKQIHSFRLDAESYERTIAPARTYAMVEEAETLRKRGLFSHLTPQDMLVIGGEGPIDNTFRFVDEPVRHKILDLVGDLALVGRPVIARVVASRSGHALNAKLAREIVEFARRAEHRPVGPLEPAMNINRILRLLPHRFPMVLVDRVLEIEGDRRAVGVKNVSFNEPFFQGHYPDSPIMPGVLIVEAMSQLAGLMLSQKLERTGKIAVLLSLDNVKLRKPVTPGDQLMMETEAIRATERFGDVQCRATVNGQLVAEARVKFMMVDAEQG